MEAYECKVTWTEKDGSGHGGYTTVEEAESIDDARMYLMDDIGDIIGNLTNLRISIKRMA